MQSAKSLRKLKSATTAYLEDGGALIHNIDTLIRDVHRAIQDLDAREKNIIDREQQLSEREAKLEKLNDRIEAGLSQLIGLSCESSSAPTSTSSSDHSPGEMLENSPAILENESLRPVTDSTQPSAIASPDNARPTTVRRAKKRRRPIR